MTDPHAPAPALARRRKWLRIAVWGLALGVVYPLSILLVVALYWLKTDHDYNMLTRGGWHAFSQCLVQQIPVNSITVK